MSSIKLLKSENIFQSFKSLTGNTRIMVIGQNFWAVSFAICNFYLSLYMQSQGVTDKQLGFLISLGFVAGIFSSLVSGIIVEALGRRIAMTIFDIFSWPFAFLLYAISNNYWMFVVAVFVNKFGVMVTNTTFNCLIVEGASKHQRISAFNLINIISTSMGLLVPLGGIAVNYFGLVRSERTFLLIAVVIMTSMALVRNRFLVDLEIGRGDLPDDSRVKTRLDFGIFGRTISVLREKPIIIVAMCLYIFFQMYVFIGSYNSLYFVPYLTGNLKLDKSAISILGAIFSAVTLAISVLLNPILLHKISNTKLMLMGFSLNFIAFLVLIMAPQHSLSLVVIHVAIYATGSAILTPHLNSLIANVTTDEERTGVFTLLNTANSLISSLVAVISGYIFAFHQVLIFIMSLSLILVCFILVVINRRMEIRVLQKQGA